MPKNKQATIRYGVIDSCLTRKDRNWTLQDLNENCTQRLGDLTGRDEPISIRTTQRDLQAMRDIYKAPIAVNQKKYYTYSDSSYSIKNQLLSEEELQTLHEILNLLGQFQEFEQVRELQEMVLKVETQLKRQRNLPKDIIAYEKVELVVGKEYLTPIYQAIVAQNALRISYQPFHYPEASTELISPYFLKEYNSRWYVLGYHHTWNEIKMFALDRIKGVTPAMKSYEPNHFISSDSYFKDIIGVSLPKDIDREKIILRFAKKQEGYLKTRPWHHSQTVLEEDEGHLTIQLQLIPNYELRAKILSFGEDVEVLAPVPLREEIYTKLEKAIHSYQMD